MMIDILIYMGLFLSGGAFGVLAVRFVDRWAEQHEKADAKLASKAKRSASAKAAAVKRRSGGVAAEVPVEVESAVKVANLTQGNGKYPQFDSYLNVPRQPEQQP